MARYTKTRGSYLLDGGTHAVAIGQFFIATLIFTPFTRIAFAAKAIHSYGKRRMRFVRDRAKGHGTRCKTLIDRFGRFYFVNRNGRPRAFKVEEGAERAGFFALVVYGLAVFFKNPIVRHTRAVLQQVNGGGIEQVRFAFALPLVHPANRQMLL